MPKFIAVVIILLAGCDFIDRPKITGPILEDAERMYEAQWGVELTPQKRAAQGERMRCLWESLDERDVDPRRDFACLGQRMRAGADCYEQERRKLDAGEDANIDRCTAVFSSACDVSGAFEEVARDTCPPVQR